MSISSIEASNSLVPSQMVSKMANKMVKELDTNSDGSIDKKEFVAGLKNEGISATDAEKMFNSIDTKGTGKISQADIESSMKKMGAPSGDRGGEASKRSAWRAFGRDARINRFRREFPDKQQQGL